MSKPNSLDLAADLGEKIGGSFGRLIFEEMEIAFLLMAAKQPFFTTGLKKQRVRENLIFVAPPAWGKSFLAEHFIENCMGAVSYSQSADLPGHPPPVYAQLDGGTITTEVVRGGCTTDGRPIIPLALKVNLFFCSDLPTFLGTNDQRNKALNMLLSLAEGGVQEVVQLKFSELKDTAAQRFQEECEAIAGLSYIAGPPRGYKFQAYTPYIFCTTAATMRGGKGALEETAPGVLSRFTIREWSPSDHEVEGIWLSTPGDVSCDILQALNRIAWKTPFHSLPFPPDAIFLEGLSWIYKQISEATALHESSLVNTLDRRLKMRLARLLVASAIAREFQGRDALDHTPIKTLNYGPEDLEFAKRLLSPHLGAIADKLARDESLAVRRSLTPSIRVFKAFLKTLPQVVPDVVSRRAFYLYCSNVRNLSQKTFGTYLTELKAGNIVKVGYGSDDMITDPSWLHTNGFIDTRTQPEKDRDTVEEHNLHEELAGRDEEEWEAI